MHNCCIRVTALLECFNWTSNKPYNRTGALRQPCHQSQVVGSCNIDFKGRVPYAVDPKGVWSLFYI